MLNLKQFPFIIPIVVGIIIQTLKLIIDTRKKKPLMRNSIFTAGGFPSVHSGLAASISTLIFLEESMGSLLFAVSFAFTVMIAFDAMNVRYEAGKHAKYLNSIRIELKNAFPQNEAKDILKERIGHTPREVLGGLLSGILLTILVYNV